MYKFHDSIKNTINYTNIYNSPKMIHIGYGIDNNFARCAGTSIISFCKNNINHIFHFHILSLNLSDINKNFFAQLAKEANINISIYEINSRFFDGLPTKTCLPIPIYFRFLLPIILKDIPKIYYIDSDVICLNNLTDFFNINLGKNIIAAVPDNKDINDLQNLKLELKNHIYFNSGILIIDTMKWNASNITQKSINLLIENPKKYDYPDQDALNLVLHQQVKYIYKKYNYYNNNKISTNDNISLLHFVHIPKPWHLSWYYSHSINPYNKYLYKNFEDTTPWGGANLLHCLKHIKKCVIIQCI